jgi:hypothetical protein
MKKFLESHEYTIDIVGVIRSSSYNKEENKDKFLIKVDNSTGNFEIEFLKRNRIFIWRKIFEIICSGYAINMFTCKDDVGKNILVDASRIERGKFNLKEYSNDYLFNTLPENAFYCKIYFRPKYDIIFRSIRRFNNELYYNCSEEEKENIIKVGKLNANKEKIILSIIPSECFIKFNHKYGSGYKLNFFENIKTKEIFSYDTFSNKSLIFI